jgi:predicted nuclease of predicted toxin-antitoxin system
VKLLLDEQISRRLVPALESVYPGSTQVTLCGLERATDREIWEYARKEGFVIVTKDDDFFGLTALYGYPPKVIRLALGNCPNSRVLETLLRSRLEIERLTSEDNIGWIEVA